MSNAFPDLTPEGKLQKILHHLDVGGNPVPAPWVEWLLDQYGPHSAVAPGTPDADKNEALLRATKQSIKLLDHLFFDDPEPQLLAERIALVRRVLRGSVVICEDIDEEAVEEQEQAASSVNMRSP